MRNSIPFLLTTVLLTLTACDAADFVPDDEDDPVAPTEQGTYQLRVQPPFLNSIEAGELGMAVVMVVRDQGFGLPVDVTVSSEPAGLTVALDSAGNADTYIVRVSSATTTQAGQYIIDVTGTVPNRPAQTKGTRIYTRVTETPAITSCLGHYDFVARQDGSGPWVPITTAAEFAALDWPSGRGGLALVREFTTVTVDYDVPGFHTSVLYGTRDELIESLECGGSAYRRYFAGNIINAGGGDVKVAVRDYTTALFGVSTSFVVNTPPMATDLVAWSLSGNFHAGDKVIIRRGVSAPSGSTLPVLDFLSAEAFQITPHQLAISDAEIVEVAMQFRTAGGTVAPLMCYSFVYNYGLCSVSTTNVYPGIPEPRVGDAHRLNISANDRWTMTCLKQATDYGLTLPAVLTGVDISRVANSPTPLYRMRYTRHRDYNGGVRVEYLNRGRVAGASVVERMWELKVSGGYLGNATVADVSMPALDNLPGWRTEWGLLPNPNYTVEARGWTDANTMPEAAECGQESLPFQWPEKPHAGRLRAAWTTGVAQ